MKTAGAAIVALNRGYDFGRQYPAYACVSHHRFSTISHIHTVRFQIQCVYRICNEVQSKES